MRSHFKAQNPGMTFGELAKYTSAMYAEMTLSEKEAWNARAESDKQRYLHELTSYVPPPGYDAKGDLIQATPSVAYGAHGIINVQSGKRSKIQKDPNAPKRNVSAYLLYQNAMRAQFKSENPDMTFGQLAKYTSHMYKNLTPDEKATWDARAQQDKARYDEAISRYVPPPGHDARGNLITVRTGGKRSKRGPKDPAAPKRARGSFVFFTFEMRPIIMKENPNTEFVQMGTILGERWRALTPEQKKRYEDMSAQDKVRFQMEMEKYKVTLQQQQSIAHANAQQAQLAQTQIQQAQMNALNSIGHQQIQHQQHYYTDPNQQIQHEQQLQVDPNQQQYVDPNQQQHYEQQIQQQQYEQQQLQQQQYEQQQYQQQFEQQQQEQAQAQQQLQQQIHQQQYPTA